MADAISTPIPHGDSHRSNGHNSGGNGHSAHGGRAVAALQPHVVPMKILVGVWLALMVLTVVTVGVTHWDFGGGINLWIAMAIATLKASLVAMYFMHLRYDSPFYGVILVFSLLFVMLFIGFALMDTTEYESTLIPHYAPLIKP